VLPIGEEQHAAAAAVAARLRDAGLRVHLDERETLNYRIREGEMAKVPYLAVIGGREAEAGTVAVRVRGTGNKQEVMPVAAFVERLVAESKSRALVP
jgi:threonyl-tRNA synthetase